MSKNRRNSWAHVKCPFFHADESGMKHAIYCEGPKDDIGIRLTFPYKLAQDNWEKKYCRDLFGYHYCPICQMNVKKYEE